MVPRSGHGGSNPERVAPDRESASLGGVGTSRLGTAPDRERPRQLLMDGESFALVLLAGAKWITYLGLMGLTGALAVSRLLASAPGAVELRDGADGRLRLVAAVSAVVLVLGAAARLYAQTWSVFGLDEPVTFELVRLIGIESRWAGGWQPQAGAAVLAVVGAAWWTRRPRDGWWLTALAAAGAWITLPLTGHAASFDSPLPHLSQVAHGIGAGLWVGALAVVVAVAPPLRREPGGEGRVADLVRRFSPVAVVAVATIVLSGVVTGVFHLGSVDDLWTAPYGRALLLKVVLFLTTGAVGAYNWRRLTPRLGEAAGAGRLLRSARLELLLAAAVLLVTAVLAHLAMPRETM